MTKKLLSFIFLNLFMFSFSQNVNIPDPELKFYLVSITPEKHQATDLLGNYIKVDMNGDGEIQSSEAENIKSLYSSNLLVKNIAGLEAFKNLSDFSIISNVMLGLDLSNVKSLKSINITDCLALSFLNLKGLSNLEKVTIYGSYTNHLNNIDFSDNIKLKSIGWSGKFNTVDLSNNLILENLSLYSENLSDLNINKNTKLKTLSLANDKLRTIDFSLNIDLETVVLAATNINSANFNNNKTLQDINISGNNFSSLILPQSSNLKNLILSNSKLKTIDLSNQLDLNYIKIYNNLFTVIDFSKNINLLYAEITNESSVKSLDFSRNFNLQTIWFDQLINLESLYIKNNKQQFFSESYNNCPKLNYVCCDESEKLFFVNKNVQTVVTDCLLATQDIYSLTDFKIYPNPTSDYLNFNQKVESIKILDIQGNLILDKKIDSNNFNISKLKNGVYFLEASSNNNKMSQKFIKK